ncbi:hypothetical protein CVD28_15405 [Bacillus sp. M6-12]|uniref:helix-turn-helix domain-containing protein n=1 Tax=Bacillus sp. M6-12 TaxID=2054166 RepID=UPI000C75B4EF|nr:helix-turn-helix transcriptional regulator [Bacillus sp. M6-12]PLS16474.1 hypothetical protein CVD28_15405 [Bacillus sp. M6-12]
MSLQDYAIGEALKDLREYKKISIEELTKDICSEDEYKLFERESKYPTIDQLHSLAGRLNVDLNYFFTLATKSYHSYSDTIADLISKYKKERNYIAISKIIEKEKNNPIFMQTELKQYLLWHEGICVYYLESDISKAEKLLYQAIDLTNPKRDDMTERELEILTSIAILQKEEKNYREAISLFTKAYNFFQNLPEILNPKAYLRVLFGLSQALTLEGEYEDSLVYSTEGIAICLHYETLYTLAELHYQTGFTYLKLEEFKKGNYFIKEAHHLFELQGNQKMAEILKIKMENLMD